MTRTWGASFAFISSLLLAVPAAHASDSSPCAGLLATPGESSAEWVILQAAEEFLGTMGVAADAHWLSSVVGSASSSSVGALLLNPPPGVVPAEVADGLAALDAIVSSLESSGSLDRRRLDGLFEDLLRRKWEQSTSVSRARHEASEGRAEIRAAVTPVPVGSPVRHSAVVLPSGNRVVAGREGRVVFFRPDGSVLSSFETQQVIEIAPRVLRDGSVLVFLLPGSVLHFDSVGQLIRRTEAPRLGAAGLPLLRRNGGVFLIGDLGQAFFLNPDGTDGPRLATGHWVCDAPIELDDGAILYVTVKGEVVRMDPGGSWKVVHRIGSGAATPPVQLRDGSIVVSDHQGRVHFMNRDGAPKKKWGLLNVVYRNPRGNGGYSLLPLPDGRVAATSFDFFAILGADGKALVERKRVGSHLESLLLEDGSVLVELETFKFGRFFGFDWRASEVFFIDGYTTVPLVAFGRGRVAQVTTDHRLKVFELARGTATKVFEWQAPLDLRSQPLLLMDGRFAIGGDGGYLYLLDPMEFDSR